MAHDSISVSWSDTFSVASDLRGLGGDKILLPPSALEELLNAAPRSDVPPSDIFATFDPSNPYSVAAAQRERALYRETQQQLPQPLMFRLRNQQNGNVVYAGIREFSADANEVALSPYLKEALGIQESGEKNGTSAPTLRGVISDSSEQDTGASSPAITVEAKTLPKGTFVRLRPLEAGYNPSDWKPLLERQLRESFTTLTKGAVFPVRGVKGEAFRFLVDEFKPEGDGICVVDTDLEVEIEALSEEQARETLEKLMAQSQRRPDNAVGSSEGGQIDIWKPVKGQVLPGDHVDYELPSWDRSRPLQIEISEIGNGEELDLFASPMSPRHRALPRQPEHVFGNFDLPENGIKSIVFRPANVEVENAEKILIAVHGWSQPGSVPTDALPRRYVLRAKALVDDPATTSIQIDGSPQRSPGEEQCKNCQQWIPSRTIALHENFCLRNNILCPLCKQVFHKKSPEWQAHWHCDHGDGAHGNSASSKAKHYAVFHAAWSCPSDTCARLSFSSLPELARHQTSTCPGKLILCQFCYLEVPQEGDPYDPAVAAETALTGLTPHERADGARTTNCHLCGAIVRLRDMKAHMRHHELDKQHKVKPEICRNALCGRTQHGVGPKGQVGAGTGVGQGPGNAIGLCSLCFGPLYVSMHDPESKALRRRIERRYLSQLLTGCGKKWCANEWCKTGRTNLGLEARGASTAIVVPLVRPLLDEIHDHGKPMNFCVDEGSQQRRKLAEMLAAERVWDSEWCVAACEAEGPNLDKAREWLINWAPTKY